MKKTFIILATLIFGVIVLSACTPNEEEIQNKYQANGYVTTKLDEQGANELGIELTKVDYIYLCKKGAESVYIVSFIDGKDATELYNSRYETRKKDKIDVVKKGNAVVFGDPESVVIIKN